MANPLEVCMMSQVYEFDVTLPFTQEAIDALGPRVRSAVDFAIRKTAIRVQNEAKGLMPIRTGVLRSSFRAQATQNGVELEWRAPYAEVVDIGAPAHEMVAPTSGGKKAYRFRIGGKTIFAKRINHPGQKGRFYSLSVLQLTAQILGEELRKAMNRARGI